MKKILFNLYGTIKAMGLVFGDIGTSPIYTLSVIFLTTLPTKENVISVLSLIIWTLILVVFIQYVFFAMSLSKRGEGGSIVLNQILKKVLKSSRATVFFSYLTYAGVSLLIGDSVITPAISILSAVEGLGFVPGITQVPRGLILLITITITVLLFVFQKKGIERVTQVFGPIMLVWFAALGVSGAVSLFDMPDVFAAFNPLAGINFLANNSLAGFFVLSQVILCATGAEALYADMGQLGRKPIIRAWYFVFTVLVLNYLGQGAYLIKHPNAQNIIFAMISGEASVFYIPFLIISILATIIASQAMISGLFSIIYQAINTHILPLLKINFTSPELKSQIYIDFVNWVLMFCVISTILIFGKSSALAGAYGFAVSGTILITSVMICSIFFLKRRYIYFLITLCLLAINLCFFIACFSKLRHGALWSVGIALVPFLIIVLYINGSRVLYSKMVMMSKKEFLKKYSLLLPKVNRINGTALFFTKGIERIAPYIVNTIFVNNIIYTDNVFVSISKTNEPHGVEWNIENIAEGLRALKIVSGYMEVLDLNEIFKSARIKEKAIFYGVEDIESRNVLWIIFAKIKKLTPAFTQFYKLPAHKAHGIMTQINMN